MDAQHSATEPVLEFDRVSFSVPGRQIFNEASFVLRRGAKAAVSGASGAGKSSLLKLVCGVYAANQGKVVVDGIGMSPQTASAIRHRLCYLPQKISAENLSSVEEFIMLPFTFTANRESRPETRKVAELLDKLGLDRAIMHKKMGDVSGGERQRLALIRGLLLERDILLLDEPASAIDPENSERMVKLVDELDVTLLAVSHGKEWHPIADTVIVVSGNGSIRLEGK